QPWPEQAGPRRAGVNSFGLGGTNAHVVLEQPPARPERPSRPGPHLLTFSAVDDTALTAVSDRLSAHLAANPELDLADVAFTLQVSRGGFALRRAVVCTGIEDAIAALADPDRWITAKTQRRNPKVRLVRAEVAADWQAELAEALAELRGTAVTGDTVTALADALATLGVQLAHDSSDGGEQVVVEPQAGQSARAWLLATLARLWQAGSSIDWPAL